MNRTVSYYLGVAVALILFIGGCAPVQATYYKPMVNDGYYKGPCGGPDNYGATRLNEKLAYFVSVETDSKEGISATQLNFNFRVFPGSILTLASGTVTVSGNDYHFEIPIGNIHRQEWKPDLKKVVQIDHNFSDRLIGYPETNLPKWTFGLSEIQKWGGFSFEIKIPPFFGDELSVTLPIMKVDGEVVNSSVLKVIKVNEHYWQFIC